MRGLAAPFVVIFVVAIVASKGWISPVNRYFYSFILNMLQEQAANGLARCRNTVATRFSRSDPDGREPGVTEAPLDYSDDCEVLEIILPAEFKTVELE